MGRFINMLVPDFIYKSDDEYSGMGKMFLAGAGLFLYVSAFITVICYLCEGRSEIQWYAFVYIMMIAAFLALACYFGVLSLLSIFVKLTILLTQYLLKRYYGRRGIGQHHDNSIQVQKDCPAVNGSSFCDHLKCADPDGLIALMKKSQEAGADPMFLLTTVMILIQNDVVSFGNMKDKNIHESLVAEFGDFISYSYFNTLWNRIRRHDFKSSQLDEYDEDVKELYTEEDRDFDKYYRAHKNLKENGYI